MFRGHINWQVSLWITLKDCNKNDSLFWYRIYQRAARRSEKCPCQNTRRISGHYLIISNQASFSNKKIITNLLKFVVTRSTIHRVTFSAQTYMLHFLNAIKLRLNERQQTAHFHLPMHCLQIAAMYITVCHVSVSDYTGCPNFIVCLNTVVVTICVGGSRLSMR